MVADDSQQVAIESYMGTCQVLGATICYLLPRIGKKQMKELGGITPEERREMPRDVYLEWKDEQDMAQEELERFKELLAKYLDMQCVRCQGSTFEDRHIVTCVTCGVVIGDLKTVVSTAKDPDSIEDNTEAIASSYG